MSNLGISALSLRNRAISAPDELSIASDNERISVREFSEMVNAFAEKLTQIPDRKSFVPVLVGTNISSVIVYHAAILARIPVALIDGNINDLYLEKILQRLDNPTHIIFTEPEFANSIDSTKIKVSVGRERAIDFTPPTFEINSPAIVIFSSGSTSEPKGSVWSWHHLELAWQTMVDYYAGFQEIRVGRVSSVAYAAGAYQMMSATLPHNLHLINPKLGVDEILDFANMNELNTVAFSTSFAERIFDQRSPGKYFEFATDLVTYGEAVSWDQLGKIRQLLRKGALIRTSYGASEAPGSVTYFTIKPEDPLGRGRVPLSHVDMVRDLEFLPREEDPEIKEVIIHNHASLGYLGDPQLTATKFSLGNDGESIYRTGDLVRIDDKGFIHFVGRGDDLVKINGRLVGPTESEALLRTLKGIATVAVLPHVTKAGKNFLTAHIVREKGSSLSPADVYEYLLANLSSHLVPAQLALHESLPLNVNGKIDRKVLQGQVWPRWKNEDSQAVPTIYETFVLSQLRRILNTPDLSLTEDVFGSGMDSLAALEFEAIAAEFGYENIKPSIFLEHRTPREIAKYIAGGEPLQESNLVEINRGRLGAPLFVFPGAGVTAIFFKSFADELSGDRPTIVIEPRGLHTNQPIEHSIEEMAESAAIDINAAQPQGEIHIVGHSAGASNAVATAFALKRLGRDVKVATMDHISLTNNISMSPMKYAILSRWFRLSDLFTRSPKSIWRSLLRRKAALEKRPYEFFTLHIGKLGLKYKAPTKPDFPILFMYCGEQSRRSDWKETALHNFVKIAGTHFTMLNDENLPALISTMTSFFGK